jgi:hypothetical protein
VRCPALLLLILGAFAYTGCYEDEEHFRQDTHMLGKPFRPHIIVSTCMIDLFTPATLVLIFKSFSLELSIMKTLIRRLTAERDFDVLDTHLPERT